MWPAATSMGNYFTCFPSPIAQASRLHAEETRPK